VSRDADRLQGAAAGAVGLRRDAENIAGALPPLLTDAEMLAATVSMGVHGRRRAGTGEDFWQYRQAMPGDAMSQIDWRRSGRSDSHYIRQMEWESAQTLSLWVDDGRSMDYRGPDSARTKHERAALIALALAVLLIKAGERVSLMGTSASPPRSGRTQLNRLAMELASSREGRPDYGAPPAERMSRGGRAVFLSDFLGDPDDILPVLDRAADQGVKGCFVQVLDETEEVFPFDGRVIFESMSGALDFETQRARALRDAYLERLAERRARLDELARRLGWRVLHHRTSESPRAALLWLYMAIGPQG
jgi:uncharacterized protein (DUF58 family)